MTATAITIDTRPAEEMLAKMQTALRIGSKEGVLIMAREIAGAMAATTKVSKATRTIVQKKPGGKVQENVFYAKRDRNPLSGYIGIVAFDKADARRDKRAQIKQRGLAKNAWFWVLQRVGGGSRSAPKGGNVRKRPKYYQVKDQHTALNPAILLHNKLDYAGNALKTTGKRATIDNIGQRAANRFKRKMEKKAQRAGVIL